MVGITVFERGSGKEITLDVSPESTVGDIKAQINEMMGVPIEYQQLLLDDSELEDTQLVPLNPAVNPYDLSVAYSLDGSGPKIDTGRFELKIRLMCWTVCAIDEHWNKCQLFCVHCQCSIM